MGAVTDVLVFWWALNSGGARTGLVVFSDPWCEIHRTDREDADDTLAYSTLKALPAYNTWFSLQLFLTLFD